MNKLVARDKRLREVFYKTEKELRLMKAICENNFLSDELRYQAGLRVSKLGGKLTKIKNRCVVTGRSRGVFRYFKMSRMSLKLLGSQGKLVGLERKSW